MSNKHKNDHRPIETSTEEATTAPVVEAPAALPSKTPIKDAIHRFFSTLKVTAEAIIAEQKAYDSIPMEGDILIRTGNRTNYRIDAEAAASAKMEPLLEGGIPLPGKWCFTISTMEGRRVDDVLYCYFMHVASFLIPSTPRADLGKDGKPKMQTHDAARKAWVASLGFSFAETGPYKLNRTLFADVFAPLKAELESLIPERFEGTLEPVTAKQMIALIAPARLGNGVIYRVNVYKPEQPLEKTSASVNELTLAILDGFNFQRNAKGDLVGSLATFYAIKVAEKLAALRAAEDARVKLIEQPATAVA